jgi:hypothetical protein
MRVVLLVLIILWPATAQARWAGTAEQWADLQSRDAYGDMDNWFNSLSRLGRNRSHLDRDQQLRRNRSGGDVRKGFRSQQ